MDNPYLQALHQKKISFLSASGAQCRSIVWLFQMFGNKKGAGPSLPLGTSPKKDLFSFLLRRTAPVCCPGFQMLGDERGAGLDPLGAKGSKDQARIGKARPNNVQRKLAE